jgi:hypothetical protein
VNYEISNLQPEQPTCKGCGKELTRGKLCGGFYCLKNRKGPMVKSMTQRLHRRPRKAKGQLKFTMPIET